MQTWLMHLTDNDIAEKFLLMILLTDSWLVNSTIPDRKRRVDEHMSIDTAPRIF